MSMLTQGTQIYVLAPKEEGDGYEVLNIQCATAFNPGGAPSEQIEDTCLEETDARTYLRGLRTPGSASLTINADPRNASHVRLHQLSETGEQVPLKWAVGWSDGKGVAPTVAAGAAADDFVLPPARTWFTFQGYVSDFPFDFTGNAVVSTQVAIQRSGGSAWLPKVSP
ncbi:MULTISPECIES: phage tail tube protein [unclassified Variovorax]|uniref:phage tail tube protein n=1 Tax=unclassified Variovorax TaxID=663243 RepID=UPI00257626DC|nr:MULTISPECIES: phage tail tube protein [unclassified Variovorax]MDM0090306.1 phage tail tube protein [Variovorax sp. J22G40]MDM0148028.1 phage tail tube protein [Variovorax sp. J2P1-31]